MTCLRQVLLYAEDEDAVIYAKAANAAAVLANDAAEGLDSVRLKLRARSVTAPAQSRQFLTAHNCHG
jgi:hypothetical protein